MSGSARSSRAKSLTNGDRFFLDTNILVYSLDPAARDKRQIAEELVSLALEQGMGMISFQVIQEVCAAVRKFERPLSPRDLREYLDDVLVRLCQIHSSVELYRLSLSIAEESGYSTYDSLIVAAAVMGRCRKLYSEDLQHGRVIAGSQIVNPFLSAG